MSEKNISIARVAQAIDISTVTLWNWYQWYEDDTYEKPVELKLPEYEIHDKRGTKFFSLEDVTILMDFKNKLQGEYKGIMAKYNADHHWGKKRVAEMHKRQKEREKKKNEQKKSRTSS